MQVLTNSCVFFFFLDQGAKIFIVYNLQHLFFLPPPMVPLEERYRDFTVFGQGFFCYCWHTVNMSWWYCFQLDNVLLSGIVHFL